MENTMHFESDDFFNKYDVGVKLGHGHYAEVKHCINNENKREYAAKFIKRRQLLDQQNVGMNINEIEREANILKILDHQNIIKLYHTYDLGKSIVLLLELVSGGELFDHISDSEKLSEEEASEFVEQIIFGLQHMHDRNIVHLDLKPENVMIENLKERKIKLIDFGLAREIRNSNTVIDMQGTAEFLAPEVIEYNPISYATDMWAIGVITYIMLTGVSPFSGDDQMSTFQNIVSCRLEFDNEICSDMTEMAKSFIKSLLILNARKRSKASECLVHPWIKPMEPTSMFRRRSSIISRDKLLNLKHFVVSPSPPNSSGSSPYLSRKCANSKDIIEEVAESTNSDDFEAINFNADNKNDNKEAASTNVNENSISFAKSFNSNQNDESPIKDIECLGDINIDNVVKVKENSNVEISPDNCGSPFEDGSSNLITKKVSSIDEKSNKPSFSTTISNSVKRINSTFESITSFFDTKSKSSSVIKTQRHGSLKNLFTVTTDSVFVNLSKESSSAVSGETRPSNVQMNESEMKTKPLNVLQATSPTNSKKSIFFNRYVSTTETKKK